MSVWEWFGDDLDRFGNILGTFGEQFLAACFGGLGNISGYFDEMLEKPSVGGGLRLKNRGLGS